MTRSSMYNCGDNRHHYRHNPVLRSFVVNVMFGIMILVIITTTTTREVDAFHIPLTATNNIVIRTNGLSRVSDQVSSRKDMVVSWSWSALPPWKRLINQRSTGTLWWHSISSLPMTTSATTDENETNNTIIETEPLDAFFMSSTEDTPSKVPVVATSMSPTSRNSTTGNGNIVDNTPKSPSLQASPPPPPPTPKDEFVETFSKAAWQMGSDFFVALRWGAANALTSSLPENQRQILLERLDPTATIVPSEINDESELNVVEVTTSTASTASSTTIDNDDGYDRVTNSINEAVVASMVTKSQKDEQKWDREKEKILLQAEIAAQKRVETELAIQQQRYEVELQRLAAFEKNQRNADSDDSDDDDDDDDNDDDDDDAAAAVRHPVLGPVLYDFGYKRLHLVPADVLATIPVWKKQRTYRHERAKSMSVDKMKTLHLGFPGVICIHEERSTGKIAIIDGQHRVGMMKILQEKQKQIVAVDDDNNTTTATIGLNLIDLDHILVEVYTETEPYLTTSKGASKEVVGTKDHAQDLFTEINKAEPVKLVDMPGVATSKERKMISQACGKLEEQYTIMFRPSQKCRPPNVNIDNLRDTIFASNILKRHNIQTSSQLYDWLIQQNIQMGTKFTSDNQLQASLNDKVWNKAQSNDFYLGLDSSWLYN